MKGDEEECNPPLMATYKHLLDGAQQVQQQQNLQVLDDEDDDEEVLPVIDLLQGAGAEQAMVRAASEWGFFQVTNHGVPQQLLDELHEAQLAAFRRPFHSKLREPLLDDLESSAAETYRWGTPTATCLDQLSWSEAYHIPISSTTIACSDGGADDTIRPVMEEVSSAMSKLAMHLAGILVAGLGDDEEVLARCTRRDTCFLRLNRYPACGAAAGGGAFGLCPHTDSDFLTILHQPDAVDGLQLLKKDGRWVAVRPNPGALVINVGDLLQAWSNDRYRSVEHRVLASAAADRFSVAFFLCPAYDTLIRPRVSGSGDAPRYRSFTFGEYRNQVREDVRLTGRKLGLQRFRSDCIMHQAAAAHCDTYSKTHTKRMNIYSS